MTPLKSSLAKLLTVSSVVVAALIPSTAANADQYISDCVRQPTSLNDANSRTTRGVRCQITKVSAQLRGQDGRLHTYQFSDGRNIKVFIPPMNSDNPHPHLVYFSVRRGEWLPGHWLEGDLVHDCGGYACHWSTTRDLQGRIIVAERGSF